MKLEKPKMDDLKEKKTLVLKEIYLEKFQYVKFGKFNFWNFYNSIYSGAILEKVEKS